MEAVSLSDDDDDGNDSLTPRRASNSNPRANVKVIVSSPPHARPKRRQRVGMDGESADVSSTNVEQSELVENMSDELWAGTGKVRSAYASDLLKLIGRNRKCVRSVLMVSRKNVSRSGAQRSRPKHARIALGGRGPAPLHRHGSPWWKR